MKTYNSTFSKSNFLEEDIPSHLTADYLHIVYLAVIFLLGLPLNTYSFVRLMRRYNSTKSRIVLLSIHLNVSDTMTLLFYAFVKICWLFTYRWLAGTVVCKLVKFLQTMSFCLSSNVVVCIGLDRLFSLLKPLQIKFQANRRCKRMLAVGWTLATVCSLPQLYVWTVFEVSDQWSQCVDVWHVADRQNLSTSSISSNFKTLHNFGHLAVVFWLPLVVVIFCYAVILEKVHKNLGFVTADVDDEPDVLVQTGVRATDENANVAAKKKRTDSSVSRSGAHRLSSFVTLNTNDERAVARLRRHVINGNAKRARYRTLRMSVMIILAYVCFWLPYNSLALWSLIDYNTYRSIENYVYLFYGLISVNAVINPVIYSRFSFGCCCKFGRRATAQRPTTNR